MMTVVIVMIMVVIMMPTVIYPIFQYIGDWYEVYKFYASFENGQACARAHYELKPDGHILIVNSGFK